MPMPVKPGLAEVGQRLRDVVGIADYRQAAHALRVAVADLLEFLGAGGILRGDVLLSPRMLSTAFQSACSTIA